MMTIPSGKIVVITVKVLSVILSLLMLMFIFGEGLPAIGEMSPRETILLVCFSGILTGLILVWIKIKAAAWIILGSSAAFWLIEIIYQSNFWLHWFFLIYPLISLLIFLSEKYTTVNLGKPVKKSRRK